MYCSVQNREWCQSTPNGLEQADLKEKTLKTIGILVRAE